jgi:regulator of RNase E activity RraA
VRSIVPESIFETLQQFDTPLLANTIDHLAPGTQAEIYLAGSIQSVTPSLGPTVGVAVTCEVDTSTPGGHAEVDLFYEQVDAIREMGVPVVWVVKCVGSRPDHECVLGDGMGKLLYAAGCVGAVTDGGVRDIPGLLQIPFAAYARLKTVHHCPMRFRRTNEPADVGGVLIRPGDIIHAGSEGVIRIPEACVEELPDAAQRMLAFERDVHAVFVQSAFTAREKRARVPELLGRHGFER